MSIKRQLVKTIKKNSKKLRNIYLLKIKKIIIRLLQNLSLIRRKRGTVNAGFVLPTVAMVSIVVILLATAIMFRSFDRAKNASNVRVNEAVLSAATPAIDRGRAKLNKLFQDKRLPRATPTDAALYTVLKDKLNEYTFGDETPLKLTYKYKDKNNQEITDTLETAWRFPIDTDNNGKFDSYTLYGIYFKTPPVSSDNKYSRARNPLEARTPPMAQGTLDTNCGANTSAVLVGNTGWIKQNNELKKSFFVYTATVPITSDPQKDSTIATADQNKYEQYKGNKGFAAVEYQQDRVQIPPNNYAVVYEDDIALTPGPNFNLNGSVFTNSNLLTAGVNGGQIQFYQVSAKASCFYEAKNAKIIVGGNLALGGFTSADHSTNKTPKVDLFKGKTANVDSKDWVRSVNSSNSPRDTAYNNLAYVSRINRLVAAQMVNSSNSDPSEVKDGIEKKKKSLGLSSFTTAEEDKIRRQQLETYFRKRTRRVPFAEVGFNVTDADPTPLLQGSGDTLRANDQWIYPTDPTDGKTGTNYTKLSLNISSTSLEPKATEPKELKKDGGKEAELGDRVLVGNNLPELWWDKTKNQFVGSGIEDTQQISGIKWDKPTDTTEIRTRRSLVQTLADVGSTERDGEWELDAARVPGDPTEPVGGLRVVTGAGIYFNQGGTPGSFDKTVTTIWPDTMPVPATAPAKKTITPYWMYSYMGTGGIFNNIASLTYTWPEIADDPITTTVDESKTPYLQMRATAVYHYKSTNYDPQNPKPIACVSSFYVPTNSNTAKNINTLPDAKDKDGNFIIQEDANGKSNNGIVYPAPTKTVTDYSTVLTYQSQLKYPNGRLIDDGLLARALAKTAANRTISEQSAIDAQICALQIKYDSTFQPVTSSPVIPHGAIREITLLDSREVKQNSISSTPPSQTYDLPIRDRQPLEIRSTVLDLDLLRKTTIGNATPSQEYLLPNSGLIYATRDGALPDASGGSTEAAKLVSPVDYRLDPTRRPNAIMLVNGDKLWRTETYRDVEKGLILATNLPVYIKGNFNRHTKEEFEQQLNDDWSQNFYSRSTLDKNFACRKGDPRLVDCTTGDEWRPATVIADAVTLLSGTFKEGYRDEGDYDWSQNNLASVPTGFSKYNNFVTNAKWYDDTGKPNYFSSYLNNFVTPVLLRTVPGAYLTEVCPVTNGKGSIVTGNNTTQVDAQVFCSDPKNWTIQTSCSVNGGGNTYLNDKIVGKNGDPSNSRIKTGYIFDDPESFGEENNKGPKCFDDNAPRRIAFVRDLITGNITSPLQVLGVDKSGKVQIFDFGTSKSKVGTELMAPPNGVTMPWLQPTVTLGNITALTPILQLRQPFATPSNPDNNSTVSGSKDNRKWLQEATDTTFNLIIVAGDSPARSDGDSSEDNGGLHNFVRFMENWQPASGNSKARISGAFMQVKKSAYATGPYTTAFSDGTNNELKYAIEISSGRGTGYLPPTRQWGYDVALLSQAPDLFANKLILTPPDLPDEYFREVGRDDKWVETLLCAKNGADNTKFAIDQDQRPSTCKS
ncbi:MAG: hormogonium polysaccharide biosynthesis protein HpsA [Fischerella sp. CENA71]|nr:hormogonium polysaccharide biosynthesis protein HpsA [Fischerella sp. CENA71]